MFITVLVTLDNHLIIHLFLITDGQRGATELARISFAQILSPLFGRRHFMRAGLHERAFSKLALHTFSGFQEMVAGFFGAALTDANWDLLGIFFVYKLINK